MGVPDVQTVGLDLGYGYVKAVGEHGDRVLIPSVVGRRTQDYAVPMPRRDTGTGREIDLDQLDVVIRELAPRLGETGYFVGDLAIRQSKDASRPFANDKASDRATQVLAAVACALVTRRLGEDIHVATGLPYVQFANERYKHSLIRSLENHEWIVQFMRFSVQPRRIRVAQVSVYPQAIAALYAFALSGSGVAESVMGAGGLVGLIDIGTRTTDLVVVDLDNNMEYQLEACGTFDYGMANIYEALQDHIQRETGIQVPQGHIEKLVRQGKSIELRLDDGSDTTIDLPRLFRVEAQRLVETLQRFLQQKWPRRHLYKHVLLAGGGATVEPIVQGLQRLAKNVISIPGAQFANAEGYLGMTQLSRRAEQVS